MACARSTGCTRTLLTPGVVVQCPRCSRAARSSSRSTASWTGYTGCRGLPPTSRSCGKGLPGALPGLGTAWAAPGSFILQELSCRVKCQGPGVTVLSCFISAPSLSESALEQLMCLPAGFPAVSWERAKHACLSVVGDIAVLHRAGPGVCSG